MSLTQYDLERLRVALNMPIGSTKEQIIQRAADVLEELRTRAQTELGFTPGWAS